MKYHESYDLWYFIFSQYSTMFFCGTCHVLELTKKLWYNISLCYHYVSQIFGMMYIVSHCGTRIVPEISVPYRTILHKFSK